jgi:hypothetical protein
MLNDNLPEGQQQPNLGHRTGQKKQKPFIQAVSLKQILTYLQDERQISLRRNISYTAYNQSVWRKGQECGVCESENASALINRNPTVRHLTDCWVCFWDVKK